jgi:hypothetical protein
MTPLYAAVNLPQGAAPTINSLGASPGSIAAGSTVTLTWSASNAGYFVISPGVGAVRGTSATVSPTQTTTYTLYATNQYGQTTSTTTVSVH